MKINVVEKYTAVVLEIKGDVTGTSTEELSNILRKLIADGKKNLILDLKETGYVNSSGLGILISGYTTAKNCGGDLKLANVTERINSLLVITKLITIFENYPSVDEAVKSFS